MSIKTTSDNTGLSRRRVLARFLHTLIDIDILVYNQAQALYFKEKSI